ncbi:MAG: transcriptional repressor [Acinetobacter populi]|uniref:Fur family transcriptional regulator n=1 Tax=Acinetobacter populi TaxID=1582270 RepID=UPI002356D9B9|nr:transcriptional repressor [Acinetobacter populi]MCH4248777.1 transcriptional repressor [Acinetobacter populi]
MTTQIQQRLKKAGLKVTQTRIAVLSLLENQTEILSVKQIYQKLYINFNKLSLATIYRVIKDLEEVGLIAQQQFHRGEARYSAVEVAESQVLQIKCVIDDHLNQTQFIHSLQDLLQKFNIHLLDIEVNTGNDIKLQPLKI